MSFLSGEVHPSWKDFFTEHQERINRILQEIEGEEFTPAREKIFRAFSNSLDEVKVVIFGQDPYPGDGVADGLAFSSPAGNPIPASLRNIFKEYSSDLSLNPPISPDLSSWSERGVLLLNRSLTTVVGERNSHLSSEWKVLTRDIAQYLGERDVIAILWGKYAEELAIYFTHSICAPHPSPLSARRGFFGSKPFSRTNLLLKEMGREPIDWQL